MSTSNGNPLLQIKGLKKHFAVASSLFGRSKTWLKAVDGMDREIEEGTTYGLVGASGCG